LDIAGSPVPQAKRCGKQFKYVSEGIGFEQVENNEELEESASLVTQNRYLYIYMLVMKPLTYTCSLIIYK